jgi:hypothetical protein
MSAEKHVLLSHGMGDKKDSRLFRGIAEAFVPRGYEFHMFSYDIEHADSTDVTVRHFDERPPILEEEIQKLERMKKVGDKLIFVGHSQGCLPLGFVDATAFDEIIWLNPMVSGGNDGQSSSMDRTAKQAIADGRTIPWTLEDANGQEYVANVPMSYFPSMHFDRLAAYRRVTDVKRPIVFRGTHDKMVGLVGDNELPNAQYHDIEGGRHNFLTREKQVMPELIEAVGKYALR